MYCTGEFLFNSGKQEQEVYLNDTLIISFEVLKLFIILFNLGN